MQISEIMTRDPELIDPNASIREAAKRMRSENVGALPVGGTEPLISSAVRWGDLLFLSGRAPIDVSTMQVVSDDFEGWRRETDQLGVNPFVLMPGEPNAVYHWEADQEDFLVVSGEAVLIVEGEERHLCAWDFVHCPPRTKHVIVGAGSGPCLVIAVGARAHDGQPDSIGFTVDEIAKRHGASVDEDTVDGDTAYASLPPRKPTAYRDGWLPE